MFAEDTFHVHGIRDSRMFSLLLLAVHGRLLVRGYWVGPSQKGLVIASSFACLLSVTASDAHKDTDMELHVAGEKLVFSPLKSVFSGFFVHWASSIYVCASSKLLSISFWSLN